jgi:NAD(P)-dependent dehydrogenase (short-subunit alcohol dehydrogenase family)
MALDSPKPVSANLGAEMMTMTYPFPVSADEFKGKRVLVTGGTKGMGQAIARRFTLSGASVATTARSPLPGGQAVALFVQTDIGTVAGVRDVISLIHKEWGGLDILVNNVGGRMLRTADIRRSLTTTGRGRLTSTCWHPCVSTELFYPA